MDCKTAPKKILVVGPPGAGKSTFAKKLGVALNIPVYHLDHYLWKPGWVFSEWFEFTEKIENICQRDSWIIDGTHTWSLNDRLFYADAVIYLDISQFVCWWRLFKRWVLLRGTVRDSMAPGCSEQLNWQFITYVFGFKKRFGKMIEIHLELAQEQKKQVYCFKTNRQATHFLHSI